MPQQRTLLFLSFLFCFAFPQTVAALLPHPNKPKQKPRLYSVSLSTGLGFSDTEELAHGISLQGGLFYSPLLRIAIGLVLGGSFHGPTTFLRGGLGLRFLLDDFFLVPLLQMSLGAQARLDRNQVRFGGDMQILLGLQVPIASRWRLGAFFFTRFPLDPVNFVVSKGLHLQGSLVF